jgi:hypothetical protein
MLFYLNKTVGMFNWISSNNLTSMQRAKVAVEPQQASLATGHTCNRHLQHQHTG